MNGNYTKIEVDKNEKYKYMFNDGVKLSDVIEFFGNIEDSHYFEHFSYVIRLAADSYEDGSYILRSIRDQNPEKFNNWNVTGINLLGYVNLGNRYVSDGISYALGNDCIIVQCNDNGRVLETVEAAFPRQKAMK